MYFVRGDPPMMILLLFEHNQTAKAGATRWRLALARKQGTGNDIHFQTRQKP
jgi:hypothetical protein